MARFDMHDLKKQASFFFREKVKNARLALTDVSRIQLLTEEATNADPWGPETRTMAKLSDAAFELEEYERIVQVLHNRLEPNAKRPWRQMYKTLTVLEYLLTHGPGSLSNEFRADTACIEDLCQFNFIDEQGIDRGVTVRKKADEVLELLSKADLRKEQRNRAQKISHGIRGFGSSIERVHIATESADHQQTVSDVSEPEDAESQSLLSIEVSKEESHVVTELSSTNSGVEWKPFEKCASIPSYLRHNDGSSTSHDDEESIARASGQDQQKGEVAGTWSPFKKSFSSPGHFRDMLNFSWQPFAGDMSKESHMTELADRKDSLSFQASNDDGDKEETKIVQLERTAPLRHRFGLQRSVKDAPQWSITEQQQQHTGQKPAMDDASSMDEPRAIEEFNVSETSHQYEAFQKSQSSLNLPVLPPPPPPKFKAKFQNHWQPSSLIDL